MEVAKDYLKPDAKVIMEIFHYSLRRTIDDNEFVQLGHQFMNARTIHLLYKSNDIRVGRAVRTFRLGRHNVILENQAPV